MLSTLTIQPLIMDKIKEGQANDPTLLNIKDHVIQGKRIEFNLIRGGTLRFGTCLCVPNVEEVKKDILVEDQCTPYTVHPRATKMYKDVSKVFWWIGLK